jgi:hypothetical protein
MSRYVNIFIFSAVFTFAAQSFATADTIKLKSGQTHEGVITAEEEERVQLKMEGSGVRLWFSRDQILSLEKTAPEREPEQKGDSDKSATETADLDEDAARARELLRKMREESEERARKKKTNPITTNPSATQSEAPAAAPQSEIEKLIDQMRNGQMYDRLNACKKLGALKAEEAIPHLIHLLDDDKLILRNEANESLVIITGENFGYNGKLPRSIRLEAIDKWKKWYKGEQKKEVDARLKSFW